MAPRHVLACCVTALACAAAQAAQKCEINGVSVNPAQARSLKGHTGWVRCTDRETGLLQREQEVQHGKLVGLVPSF